MFFHGIPRHHLPGTILLPGDQLDPPVSTNGADSSAVFATTDSGFTLDELDPDDRYGAETTEQFAFFDAFLWGACCEDDDVPHALETYVYVIEPLTPVDLDATDAGIAARRMGAARVIAGFAGTNRHEAYARYAAWCVGELVIAEPSCLISVSA